MARLDPGPSSLRPVVAPVEPTLSLSHLPLTSASPNSASLDMELWSVPSKIRSVTTSGGKAARSRCVSASWPARQLPRLRPTTITAGWRLCTSLKSDRASLRRAVSAGRPELPL